MARRRSTLIEVRCKTEAAHENMDKILHGRSRLGAQSLKNVLLPRTGMSRGSQIMVTIKSAIPKLNRR